MCCLEEQRGKCDKNDLWIILTTMCKTKKLNNLLKIPRALMIPIRVPAKLFAMSSIALCSPEYMMPEEDSGLQNVRDCADISVAKGGICNGDGS